MTYKYKQLQKIAGSSIFLYSVVFILGFIALYPSFTLALSGDDWLLHYTIWSIFYIQKSESFLNPLTYLCTYCPPYGFLGIIEHFWGYTPFYYYFFSFIFRSLAAISIYYLIKKITKNTLAGFLAAIFTSVSYVGIQTTDWVFNFNHYIGIAFAALFLIQYWKAKESLSIRQSLFAGALFTLALIVSPNRMHGLFPLIIVAEAGWWILERKKYRIGKAIIRVATLIILYRILFSGAGYGTVQYNLNQIAGGIKIAQQLLSAGQTAFLINPITTLGNYIFPNMFWRQIPFQNISFFGKSAFTLFTYILPLGIFFILITYIPLLLYGIKKKQTIYYGFLQFLWILFIYFLKKYNINWSNDYVAYGLIGGQTIIFTFWFCYYLKKTKPLFAHTLLCSLAWMVSFTLFPWIIAPNGILDTDMRYSVQQGVGLSIWMAVIFVSILQIFITKKKISIKPIIIIFVGITAFLVGNIIMTYSYLSLVSTYRNVTLDTKLWSQIYTQVPKLDTHARSVFYLTTDPMNNHDGLVAQWDLQFPFSSRTAIRYNLTNQHYNTFLISNNFTTLESDVTDGKSLITQGLPQHPVISISHVYAFSLHDDTLTNITSQIRKKLQTKANIITSRTATQRTQQ